MLKPKKFYFSILILELILELVGFEIDVDKIKKWGLFSKANKCIAFEQKISYLYLLSMPINLHTLQKKDKEKILSYLISGI